MRWEWVFLLIAAGFNMGANLLLKNAGDNSVSSATMLYFSWGFVIAVGLFGLNLVAYSQALRTIPVSVAYPTLVGLSTLLLAIFSITFFGDQMNISRLAGFVLLIASLYLIMR